MSTEIRPKEPSNHCWTNRFSYEQRWGKALLRQRAKCPGNSWRQWLAQVRSPLLAPHIWTTGVVVVDNHFSAQKKRKRVNIFGRTAHKKLTFWRPSLKTRRDQCASPMIPHPEIYCQSFEQWPSSISLTSFSKDWSLKANLERRSLKAAFVSMVQCMEPFFFTFQVP